MDILQKFRTTHISRISAKELFGIVPTSQDLISLFKGLPGEETLTFLTNISLSFRNEGLGKVELYLRTNLFSKEFQKALSDAEFRDNTRYIIFNEMTTFLLIDLCRLHSPIDGSVKLNIGEIHQKIGMAFIKANYFVNLPQDNEANPTFEESYTNFSIREKLFNESDQFRYLLGRSNLIYSLLFNQVPKAYQFDVSSFIENQYGFTLDDYFQAIIALFSHWAGQTIENWNPQNNFVHLENYFKNTQNSESLSKVIEKLTQAWSVGAEDPFLSKSEEDFRIYLYSRFQLKSKPLVRVNDRIYPMSMRFMLLLCWTGPYYLIIDKLRELKKTPDPFFHFLGYTTELYCKHQLKTTFGNKLKELKTDLSHPLGECVIQINPRWHVVFEVKAKRPNIDSITGNKKLAENRSVDMMFVQPLKQISKRIEEHRRNFVGRISPIIVTCGQNFINGINWPEYKKLVCDLILFNDKKIDQPIFLDLESFELFCATIQNNCSISELINEKNGSIWKFDDFRNFMHQQFLAQRGMDEPVNNSIRAATSDIFNSLFERLFPGKPIPTHESEADWKQVFLL